MKTIVIGHRNPDMDSVCSAMGYAHLKQQMGMPDVIAGCAGNLNERIRYVLDHFQMEAPQHFSDVSPRVSDVMQREVITAQASGPIYDAIHSIEANRLRGLPVVDGENCCLGLLSALQITQYLFPSREETEATRRVHATPQSVVQTFGGKVVAGELDQKERLLTILVAAMSTDSFGERLRRYDPSSLVLLVGDRERVQQLAIDAKVCAIIVTSGAQVSERIIKEANEAGVAVATSPHDTATTVLMARGAIRCGRMVDRDFTAIHPDTKLEAARNAVATSSGYVFPVIDEAKKLVGILSKSDFLKPIPRQLILVDHNELSQAVAGAEHLPIIEVLDHHRLGGFTSNTPMLFWNNPVGSTSSIVALAYRQSGIEIPKPIAGLLMAGLISDTLNLNSPTATAVDAEILKHLSGIAGEDPAQLAERIFSVGSPLLTMTPQQVVTADCKEYEEKGHRFTVAQVEELSFASFADKQKALAKALKETVEGGRLLFAALLVTDITTQTSILLVEGSEAFTKRISYPPIGPRRWRLDGVVSRKKQLLPYLLSCLDGMDERAED